MELQKNIIILEKFLANITSVWKKNITNSSLQIEYIQPTTETKVKIDTSLFSLLLDSIMKSLTNNFQTGGFVIIKAFEQEAFHKIQFTLIGIKKSSSNISDASILELLDKLGLLLDDSRSKYGEYQIRVPPLSPELSSSTFEKMESLGEEQEIPKTDPDKKESIHLLIAEDEVSLRDMLIGLLSQIYKVHPVSNGVQAIECLKREPVDLILSDIEMPDMDGFEMLEKIRSNPEYASVPIIFLTAYDLPNLRLAGFEGGAQDYIIKPVNNRELLARIRVHLKQRELYTEIQELKTKLRKKSPGLQTKEKIKRLIHYIDRNYDEFLTREHLAQTIGLSPDHMSRIFLETTGKKVSEYINHKRIEFAKSKLKETDETILSIAMQAGFESLRSFNRFFKRFESTTPNQYREKFKP